MVSDGSNSKASESKGGAEGAEARPAESPEDGSAVDSPSGQSSEPRGERKRDSDDGDRENAPAEAGGGDRESAPDDEEADDRESARGAAEAGDGDRESAPDDEEADDRESARDGKSKSKPEPKAAWARVMDFFKERYLGADPRWLGVHRICLGVLLMVEVLRRMYYARAFYSNDGILPNHFSLFRPMGRNLFSIYHAFSSYGEVLIAFSLTLVIFFLFTIGYKTKLFHVLSAICIVSLNNRNIFVENGGTVVVNIMTVYTVFLPMGRRFSVDAVLRSLRQKRDQSVHDLNVRPDPFRDTNRVYSLMVLLFLVQWAAIYFFNAVHKDGIGWRNGTALHWFFWQDRIVTELGIWARENVSIAPLRWMTYSTLVIEGALAVLILFPFWQTWTRRLIFVLVLALHGGIAATSRIGPFSYVMSLFPILLLGAADFNAISRWFSRPGRARTVIFQSDAGLCFQICRVLDRLDPFERLTFVDHRQTELLPKGYDAKAGLVVYDPTLRRLYAKEHALSQALRVLPLGVLYSFWPRLPLFSYWARRALGARRARVRTSEWWGANAVPASPVGAAARTEDFVERKGLLRMEAEKLAFGLKEVVVAFLAVACVLAMLHDNRFANQRIKVKRPEWTLKIMEYPRLLQGWGMFAPEPPYEDGRVIVDGRTKDGRKLDPLTGAQPDFNPDAPHGWGHEQFWCDYHNRIRYSGHAPNRQHLRDYLLNVHKFSGRPDDQLVAFDVWWVQDQSPMPGEMHGRPLKPLKLTSHGRVKDSGATPWLNYPATRKLDWTRVKLD